MACVVEAMVVVATLAFSAGTALAAGHAIGSPESLTLAAEVALAESPDTTPEDALPLIADALTRRGGLELLLSSWVLPRVLLGADEPEVVAQALVTALVSTDEPTAQRAAHLIRVIGVGSPTAFARLLARPEVTEAARQAVFTELAAMQQGPRRDLLVAIAHEPAAIAERDATSDR